MDMRVELIVELERRSLEIETELSVIRALLNGSDISKKGTGRDFTYVKRKTKYPFNKMNVGDSFFWEGYTREEMQKVTTAGRSYFLGMGDYDKKTVSAKKQGTGFRVWVINKKTI